MRKRVIKKSLSIRKCVECKKEKSNNGYIYCDKCLHYFDRRNYEIQETNNELNLTYR